MRYKALATDYDGTFAHHGTVDPATVDAVTKLRQAGAKLLMVTGREIPDLLTVFSECAIFDLIVAENGALLYWPTTKAEKPLSPPLPREFPELLRKRGVKELSVGHVIVATMENYISLVNEAITELKLNAEIILNKGSLMVLPRDIDKGTGLRAGLAELGFGRDEVVAVGDAENDQSLLRNAGFGVAVANALPLLKQKADWVTPSGHGIGVRELVDRMLKDSLPARRGIEVH
jgi:hydroxymethylpyrimidine pyrophosphatase-like HAD family hydrolase